MRYFHTIIFFLVFALFSNVYAQETKVYKAPEFVKDWHQPSAQPDRIVLNLSADPSTSMNVNWRTSADVKKGVAEIAVATAAPKFWRNAETYTAKTTHLDVTYIEDGTNSNYHSVEFKGLNPNTLYAYRVGDGSHWSEWLQFRTASDKADRFSFLYVGDAQNYVLELWSRLIREGYRSHPDADFIIHAGDLINYGHSDSEWQEWFEAGSFIHRMLPSFPIPGNHEYKEINDDERVLAKQWRPQFTLPLNGPEGLEETVYYVDYQGARIIGLDSNKDRERQAEWIKGVLRDNPNLWTVVTFHHPLYSASSGRDNEEWRALLKPIFDEYQVDIVLQGHDHSYARGRVAPKEYNLVSGVNKKDQTGTVYVVSVSGGKMYKLRPNAWNGWDADRERAAENTQLIQAITIDGNILSYESITATGELYDAFEIIKNEKGPNTFVELQKKAVTGRYHNNTISYNDQLPEGIEEKVLKAFKNHTISKVSAFKKDGKLYYELKMYEGKKKKYITIDPMGNVVSEK